MAINRWVSELTALKLGMEYPMRYDLMWDKGNKTIYAYIGELKNRENLEKSLNIILMEKFGLGEGSRSTYYLAKFIGKPRNELDTIERVRYDNKLEELCCNKNRVRAPLLESKILEFVDEYNREKNLN